MRKKLRFKKKRIKIERIIEINKTDCASWFEFLILFSKVRDNPGFEFRLEINGRRFMFVIHKVEY